jgi:SAM-dependent methyltransferase
MDRDTALNWIERWDRQQEAGLASREDRFTALIDALEAAVGPDGEVTAGTDSPAAGTDSPAAGPASPSILDIGCGPGSLSVRIRRRIPRASIIGIDTDPVTLALARAAYPDLTVKDLDLREPGWSARLDLVGPVDAAVTTTALHWLPESELRACYAELATVLRPGGVLLNGDHFTADAKQTPVLARLDRAVREREDGRRFPGGHRETWQGWWEQVAADPDLGPFSRERDRRRVEATHHGSETGQLAVHVEALGAAGFAEVGTVWQHGDIRVLCAVMPV